MPIFVKHWGDNLQFYPNFALFSTLGGMNLHHDFVQGWKFSENQKISKWNFFPQIQVKTKTRKKKVFIKNRTLFPQIQVKTKKKDLLQEKNTFFPKFTRSDVHTFKLLGDADVDHSQTIRWDTAKLLGGYIPPLFRNPWLKL